LSASPIGVVFFDLGDTLGTAVLAPPPKTNVMVFQPFDFVAPLLQELKAKGLRLGILSNTGDDPGSAIDRLLADAGILTFFDDALRIYSKDVGLTKDSPEIFRRAAERAGFGNDPGRCLFVGENATERVHAMTAGMVVAPHPLLVQEVLAGETLHHVRITVPPNHAAADRWRRILHRMPIVPLHLEGPDGAAVYGIASRRSISDLINMRFGVEFLGEPGAPLTTELFILRDDRAVETGFLSSEGEANSLFANDENARLVVATTQGGIVVALPPERSLGSLHFRYARHGHTLKLMPDPYLLAPVAGETAAAFRAPTAPAAPVAALTEEELQQLAGITGPKLLNWVDRLSGAEPLSDQSAETIRSRHISHPDNFKAVTFVAEALQAIGGERLAVTLHRFSHRGQTLYNVEAELPGAAPELIVISAHLDSTAASSHPYDEAHDHAPGADDDSSGVAAVLTLAERFIALSADKRFNRTIRFVMFNAEEEGLVGSKAYARLQRSLGASIVAVFQLDMIGYNKEPPRSWELHAGFRGSAAVEQRSKDLALLIRDMTSQVSPELELPQIYDSSNPQDGDPADGRSDHTPFQTHGYTACLATEDFFVGPGTDAPEAEGNPRYHQKEDTFVDGAFAADIARAMAAAALIVARTETGAGGGSAAA
jgi:leucyl aminopeptidase